MTETTTNLENVACQLTAQGRGAIATIWIQGPAAIETIDRFFEAKSGRLLGQTPIQRVVYGIWRHEQGPEDVIAVRLNGESLELHSHGGSLAPSLILGALRRSGFAEITQQQALLLMHGNPWQAAAVEAVQHALTLLAADRLMINADGRLAQSIDDLAIALCDPSSSQEALQQLQTLRHSYIWGRWLIHGWRVAIAGRPNVGKSSLINRLVGFDRSIVFDQPGTTRDVVRQVTAIGGWPIQLGDTAGLRSATDEVEQIGIQSARDAILSADLTIWISDLSQAWTAEDQLAIESIPNLLIIHNKSDLNSPPDLRPAGLAISLLRDPNVDSILRAIELRLFANLPCKELPFLVQAWQADVLDEIAILIAAGDCQSALQLLRRPTIEDSAQV